MDAFDTVAILVLVLGGMTKLNAAPFNEANAVTTWNEDLLNTSSLQKTELDEKCIDKQDGLYPDPYSDAMYYKCKNGQLLEHTSCKNGFYFSASLRECLKSNEEVETICALTGDGFFITPGTMCRGYYQCDHGAKTDYSCPVESYFDMATETCVRSGGICYEIVCSGRVNGQYADTTHDCRRSYVCEGGTLRGLFGCPHGTLHNGSLCVPASIVNCSNADVSAVALTLPATDHCSNMPNGFQIQPDESCRGYLLCHNGQTIAKLRCPLGEYFNGKKCAPASEKNMCISYCLGKSNGYHTDVRKHCTGYVECMNGKVTRYHSCSEKMVFNGHECVSNDLFDCPTNNINNMCLKLKNGYHQNYLSNCKEYFFCHNGEVQHINSCKGGKVFNGTVCVPPDKFLCEGPEFWPGCVDVPSGLYSDITPKSRCRYYHYCYNNKRIRLICPLGKVFNGQSCVESGKFTCPKIDVNECQEKADGYYADTKSGCRSYFYCSNGNKQTYICPNDSIYNGSECVDKTQYKCQYDLNFSKACVNKSNGYHADISTGCHMYIYCLEKIKIATFSCPPEKVFDGKKCIVFDPKNCTKTAESCSSQTDGFYADPKSECKQYFHCLNNKRTKTFFCPEGKIFNGIRCASYSCPVKNKKLTSNCDKTSTGFFQDLKSGCRNYFFCINGVKTSLSCNSSQVFNGELCVDEKSYSCPTEST